MFINSKERKGSGYIEIQNCIKKPTKGFFSKRTKFNNISHFKDTSLLISADDIDEFFEIYMEYFEPNTVPNKDTIFCFYGLNYYSKEQTEEILRKISKNKPKHSEVLVKWLEDCVKKYSGFYILGI